MCTELIWDKDKPTCCPQIYGERGLVQQERQPRSQPVSMLHHGPPCYKKRLNFLFLKLVADISKSEKLWIVSVEILERFGFG